MFARLFKRMSATDVPQELYGSVVAQARRPVFFTDYGFPDTVTGRFDLVALHLFMLSRRLVREDTTVSRSLNQEVFDRFTDETDRALRELGVGDTSVPKRKKRLVHSFYALVEELSGPLDAKDADTLVARISKRFDASEDKLIGEGQGEFKSRPLAGYLQATAAMLDSLPGDEILKGSLSWPEPQAYL